MYTYDKNSKLLDELPTLKKAIENEEIRTKQLNNTIDELNNTKNKLNSAEEEVARLKEILKENNIKVD